MKKIWPLVLLGVVAYIAFALATLPANLLLARQAPLISAAGVRGTVWNGEAQVVQYGQVQLGSLSWKVHVLPLFTARLVADVKVTRADGFVQGQIRAGFLGRVSINDLSGSLPLSALAPRMNWSATLGARLTRLELVNGWPDHAEGTLQVSDLTGPANRPANLGSYKVTFPPGASGAELVGALADTGGPFEVAGNIRLKPDRSYLLEGAVAARPDAPRGLADSLKYLGAPDAQGRRPFSLSGTM